MFCGRFSSNVFLAIWAEKNNTYEFIENIFLNYRCFQKGLQCRPINQPIRRILKGMKSQKAEAVKLADNLCKTGSEAVIIIHNCDKWQIKRYVLLTAPRRHRDHFIIGFVWQNAGLGASVILWKSRKKCGKVKRTGNCEIVLDTESETIGNNLCPINFDPHVQVLVTHYSCILEIWEI